MPRLMGRAKIMRMPAGVDGPRAENRVIDAERFSLHNIYYQTLQAWPIAFLLDFMPRFNY